MNEQVDNALGGHGFATVTSTQVGAVKDYARLINAARQVVNKHSDSIQWYEETHVDSLRELDYALESLDAASEPLYTRDELVEIVAKSMDLWLEESGDEIKPAAQASINALLATGQLKVRS